MKYLLVVGFALADGREEGFCAVDFTFLGLGVGTL
jgi:hypothetical protein